MIVKLIRDLWAKVEKPGTEITYFSPGGIVHRLALVNKLHEEAAEIAAAPWDVSEYADLFNVALKLAELNGISENRIWAALRDKQLKKGGFHECAVYHADREGHLQTKAKYP
jgi:predicted house-cleaning noncanonical NTP pyrophosphatase (MazG superfamily)